MIDTATLDKKLAAIRAYTQAGFTLIPVCSPTVPHDHQRNGRAYPCKTMGKIPVHGNWVDTAPGAYTAEELAQGNYGIVLHAGDLVIDVDPRNFGWVGEDGAILSHAEGIGAGLVRDKPLARLVTLIGSLPSTYTVRTGGDGLHVYFAKPADLLISQALRDFPGIEFKTSGRQVVGPGSLHSGTGKLYDVVKGAPMDVVDAPAKLLELLKRTAVPFSDVGGLGNYANDATTQGRYLAYLQDVAEVSVEGKGGDNNAFKVACHGRDLGLPPEATFNLMLSDWNDRCLPPWEEEELKSKVINAYRFAKGAVGSHHPAADFEPVAPAPIKEEEQKIAWVTKNDKVVKCLQNCMNYLRMPEGALRKIFAKNDFTGRIEFVNPAPWHRGRLPKSAGVGDHDLQLLRGFLAARHGYESSPKDIEDAITNVAYHERFHPVREFLESLKWDGVKRVDTWLKDYLGAVDGGYPEYLAAVSRKVLCAAVMRVMRPGEKFDHVLVLEGDQDLGKSGVCEILGGDWASDAPVDPHSRDTVDAMQGRWIIEMAEMEVLRKTDEDALKAFVTRKTDRVRLAYGRTTGEFPRQSIFIATKNPRVDGTYLKDDTGNRRWWPVRCEPARNEHGLAQIDFKGLKAVRNQLFAEALHIVKTPPGERLFMETATLKAQAKAVVAQRHAEHEWTEGIAAWIASCDQKAETRRDFLTVRDVYIEAMGGADARLDRRSTVAIAGVLRDLGWTQGFKRHHGRFQRGWLRGSTTPLTPRNVDDLMADFT